MQIKVKKNRQTDKQNMFFNTSDMQTRKGRSKGYYLLCETFNWLWQTDIWTEIPAKTCAKVDTLKVKPSQN